MLTETNDVLLCKLMSAGLFRIRNPVQLEHQRDSVNPSDSPHESEELGLEERPIKAGRLRCDSIQLSKNPFLPPALPMLPTVSARQGLDKSELMAAAVTRKRPAQGDAAPAAKKRARFKFGSIYDYERIDVLGEGSYGVVLRSRDRRTGETVAAGCLAACRGHPSIVELRDVAADAATGDVFLVMEFVGPSLCDQLTRPCSEAETRAFMRQLLRGAERMHAAGLIHRDIKPENILVGRGGALKICDFGMATPVKPARATYPEWWAGTLCYRSPEQLLGQRRYGQGVDMWALGCVMAVLLTGELLFDEDTEDDMISKVFELRHEINDRGLKAFDELPAFQGVPKLSTAGREVLAGLLSFFPDERLTATAALQHRWFAQEV
ncbi:hypothetical protein ACP70R_039263 [Stipagrostis hirtigluma subsp. patula]